MSKIANKKQLFYKAQDYNFLDGGVLIKERDFYSRPADWFETPEEATRHFVVAREKAVKQATIIKHELMTLKKTLNFYIDYNFDGDTHGIYDEYLFFAVLVDGYHFKVKINN